MIYKDCLNSVHSSDRRIGKIAQAMSTLRLFGIVVRRLSRRTLGCRVAPRHATIDHEIRSVDEAALVTSKEQDCLSLLNSLSEAASGEVNLATVTLLLVVAEPVLEEGSAVHRQYSLRHVRCSQINTSKAQGTGH